MKQFLVIVAVALAASSASATVELGITPLDLDLGSVPAYSSTVGKVVVVNTGDEDAEVDAELVDGLSYFSILRGGDPVVLHPGDRHAIWIMFINMRWSTIGVGTAAHVIINPLAPLVKVHAICSSYRDCAVAGNAVDFDRLYSGESRSFPLAVGNAGNEPLVLEPRSLDASFRCSPDRVLVPSHAYVNLTVTFDPASEGYHRGSIVLGPDVCTSITLQGECVGLGDQTEDLVGIWWNDALTEGVTEEVISGKPFHAWLAMVNPSEDVGVGGWELKLDLDPATYLTGVKLEGLAFNILQAPEFCVGIAEPLPWAPQVLLAHFKFVVLDREWHEVRLVPIQRESIPDRMAWAYGPDFALKPMYPVTGGPVVAWFQAGATVPTVAPMPALAQDGRRIELRWSLADDPGEGCHVYRAVDGRETRLTASPLTPAGGEYVFVDEPFGLPVGSAASYSYAVLQDGEEIARSPAAQAVLPAAGRNRLLDNRPNPFNPETAIAFELAAGGPVRVAVYDVSGRRVAVLLDEVRAAGAHEVVWRGRDDAGRALPSGAYYVRLETPTSVDARKMMLLK